MVERSDIEAKAKQIEKALVETKESVQEKAVVVVVAVVAVIIVAFLLGRRRGKRGAAIIEVFKA
ncbi:MAG: hypothetical protein OEM84_09075 [Acidimicrobiia bacterium]|nr:hypothetical protein [Acidimicrobiia bacterium]MDH5615548.1 hypothetical protein [Acidimicrobiia bacterium]